MHVTLVEENVGFWQAVLQAPSSGLRRRDASQLCRLACWECSLILAGCAASWQSYPAQH